MVPAIWIRLESFPLTSNGKINKNALPEPSAGQILERRYVAPGNQTELIMTEIWQELLGIERVGIEDEFF
jgi:hypothetical protein